MMKWTCLAVLGLAASPVFAASHSVKHYEVTGNTSAALMHSLYRNAVDGALGNTEVRWTYQTTMIGKNGRHRVSKVIVKRTTVFTMPFWRAYHSAPTCLQKSWDAMYASLSNHEIKHSMISDGVSEKLKAAIIAIPPQSSEAMLERRIAQAAEAIFRANSAAQAKFDRDTRHGAADSTDPIKLTYCR